MLLAREDCVRIVLNRIGMICDIVRSRRRIDEETYVNAIRNYSLLQGENLPRLFEYAEKMGLSKKMHSALELIL